MGGIGEMNAGVFDDFDYVALGHIHKGQSIGREAVRYAGAPMCYHFDEAAAGKGILVVELGEKGSAPVLRTVPVKPLHPLRNISGTVEDILAGPEGQHGEYIHVRLIGQDVTKERAAALEAFFRTRGSRLLLLDRQVAERGEADRERGEYRERSLEEYFCDYCEELRGAPPEEAELRIIRGAAELLEQMQAGGFDESSRERSAAKLAELVKREVLA